jgi:serine/threonine-protein kinase
LADGVSERGNIEKAPTVVLHRADVGPASTGGRSRDLSSDVFPHGARRIQFVSLLMAIGGAFIMVADRAGRGHMEELAGSPDLVADSITILASLAMFALARWSRMALPKLVNLALVYEVIAAAGITYDQFWNLWYGLELLPGQVDATGIGWVAVWIIVFAVVVPARPIKALIASLASAAAVPIVVALSMSHGRTPTVTPGLFATTFVMPYLVATLTAYIAAQVIYGLGRRVREAQALGSYRLERCLGRGGMGEVWLGHHRLLARPAAIKLIRPEVLDEPGNEANALSRFEREASATASLESPHTVQLFDFGVTQDGIFYYAMELLDGMDLSTLVGRHGPVPEERAVFILRQVCDSLAEAHGRGLIHRDVKPSNIFVGRYGGKHDFVKVLDFGLVKHRRTADEPSASLTQAGKVLGTPAFMAPEAAMRDDIDERADIYSLGCVAFWLLTGSLVFEETSPVAMVLAHVDSPIPSLVDRAAVPVSPALARLVESCLAKQPADRPHSAEALASELDRLHLPRTWDESRARRWWREMRP